MGDIDMAYVEQFRSNVIHDPQQQASRLSQYVQLQENVKANKTYFEKMGKAETQDVIVRHPDSPDMNVDLTRRMASMITSQWGKLIDRRDDIRVMIDPTSNFTMTAKYAFGRRKDKHIIDALIGTAYEGETGQTAVTLPAAQVIAADGIGLTIEKLKQTKKKMDEAEIEEMGRIFVFSAQQQDELLNDAKVTSTDFNTVHALVQGIVDSYLGFKFVRVEPRKAAPVNGTATGSNKHGLPYYGTTDVTRCIAFQVNAAGLAIGQFDNWRLTERSDKSFAKYVFGDMDMGATRVEDTAVVAVDCDNSPV